MGCNMDIPVALTSTSNVLVPDEAYCKSINRNKDTLIK